MLLSQGHPHARHYALCMLWDEVSLVHLRMDEAMANEAILIQLAASSMFSDGAGKEFAKQVKRLKNG